MSNQLAKHLRENLTNAERHLWRRLRAKQLDGCKFRRQHPLGTYIVDFVCLEKKLIIEVDGSQHMEQAIEDEIRTRWLSQRGYKVIRFWNNQIFTEMDSVLELISQHLSHPHPDPPPSRGRERR